MPSTKGRAGAQSLLSHTSLMTMARTVAGFTGGTRVTPDSRPQLTLRPASRRPDSRPSNGAGSGDPADKTCPKWTLSRKTRPVTDPKAVGRILTVDATTMAATFCS